MKPIELVNKQAEDDGLWFIAQTAPEAYLQRALRELHEVIEKERKQANDIKCEFDELAVLQIFPGDFWRTVTPRFDHKYANKKGILIITGNNDF